MKIDIAAGKAGMRAAPLELILRANHPLRLTGGRGRRVACASGRVWITAPGMREDLFLQPGESWTAATDALVLVEALGEATVFLTPAACKFPSPDFE
jgi:hypothetical protein